MVVVCKSLRVWFGSASPTTTRLPDSLVLQHLIFSSSGFHYFSHTLPSLFAHIITNCPLLRLNVYPTEPTLCSTRVCLITIGWVVTLVLVSIFTDNRLWNGIVFVPVKKFISPMVSRKRRSWIVFHISDFHTISVN